MKNIKLLLAVLTLTVAFSSIGSAQTDNPTFQSLNGQSVSLQNQKGKIVVLALGASWLPLSKNQAVITTKLAKKYAGKDVVFYFVATDSTTAKSKNYASNEKIQAFATQNKLTVPILRDSDGTLALKSYKVDQIPSFVLLDKQGNMVSEPFGGVTPEAENDFITQISAAIDKAL